MFCEVCGYHFDTFDNKTTQNSSSNSDTQVYTQPKQSKKKSKPKVKDTPLNDEKNNPVVANKHTSYAKVIIFIVVFLVILIGLGVYVGKQHSGESNNANKPITHKELVYGYNQISEHGINNNIKSTCLIQDHHLLVNITDPNVKSKHQVATDWNNLYVNDKGVKKIPIVIKSTFKYNKPIATGYDNSSHLDFK